MHDLIPALAVTVVPAVLLLAVAHPLRPQGGRMRTNPVPARQVLARLAHEVDTGEIPADVWGDVSRPVEFTVVVAL